MRHGAGSGTAPPARRRNARRASFMALLRQDAPASVVASMRGVGAPLADLLVARLQARAVHVAVRRHDTLAVFERGLAEIEAEGRLMVDRAERHLAGRRGELEPF